MKQLLFLFLVTLISSEIIYGQDSAGTQDSPPAQAPVTVGSYGSGSQGYGSEGYSGRAEMFVTGFGLLASYTSGNLIDHQATESGGFAAGYQLRLNSWSALEGATDLVAILRNTISAKPCRRFPPTLEGGGARAS